MKEREQKIICEKVLYQNGSYKQIERWYKGWSEVKDPTKPSRQRVTNGWQGKEEMEVVDVILPVKTVIVKKKE